MNKRLLLIIPFLFIILVIGAWFYFSYQKVIQLPVLPKQGVPEKKPEEAKTETKEVKTETEEVKTTGSTLLKSPPLPSFIKSLNKAEDVKIYFNYVSNSSDWWATHWTTQPKFYTPEGSNEHFLSLSKIKKEAGQYIYGPDYYPIFDRQGSHSYGGTPIYLLNKDSEYSVSYVGFQINNRDLISELKIEFGIDYRGMGKSKSSIFASIFGVESVYACGPALYLRPVGDSNLIFVEESNNIAWYRLEKPIALYNLPLSYCDVDCSSLPDCPNWAEPPPGCEDYPDCCHWNAKISSLANGNLRMHIFYKPNDKEGFLKLQVVNLILSDPAGKYYQPIIWGGNFDNYYRAYLH
jgi:hypothetical protein